MQAFRPALPPLWRSIVIHPVFLIAMTFVVVMSSVAIIRQKQREELASRAELLKAGPLIVEQSSADPNQNQIPTSASESLPAAKLASETEKTNAEPPPAKTANNTVAESASVAAPSFKTMASASIGSELAAKVAATGEAKANSDSKKEQSIKATIYYTEISTSALESFEEESKSLGHFTDFGEFRSGLLENVGKRMNRQSGVIVLDQVSRTFTAKTLQQHWFIGSRTSDGSQVGITTLLALDTNGDRLRAEVELLQAFIEGTGQEQGLRKSSSPSLSFELPGQHYGYMVRMPLPRQIVTDSEGSMSPDGIMRIFSSPAYKNKSSEFTLFVDFDTSNP